MKKLKEIEDKSGKEKEKKCIFKKKGERKVKWKKEREREK